MFGSQENSGLMTRYAVNTGSLGRGSAGSLRTKISELTTAQSVKCPTVLLVLFFLGIYGIIILVQHLVSLMTFKSCI